MTNTSQTFGTGAGQGGATAAEYGYGPNGGQIEQQGVDVSSILEALKLLGYSNPVTAGPTMAIDYASGGNPLGSLGETLHPLTDPWRKEGQFGIQNPDVGPHPNPTGTGSPGGTGPGPGAMIPNQAGIDALLPEYGGGESTPAPTPPPTGDNYMETPGAGLGPALDQISGGGSSPLPPGATEVGQAVKYEIQPGDSLSLIGAMFGLTYDELIEQNPELLGEHGKGTTIHPGDIINTTPTAGRGTEERAGVRDKGFETAAEGVAFSKANRPGQQARARAARG